MLSKYVEACRSSVQRFIIISISYWISLFFEYSFNIFLGKNKKAKINNKIK